VSAQLDSLLTDLVPKLIPSLCRKFPGLDPDDVAQQAWSGILERRDHLEALLEDGQPETARHNAKDLATKAVLSMFREQRRHDRAVKALNSGYDVEDETFYSLGQLMQLLPVYLDKGVQPEAPKGRDVSPPGYGDPAEGGGWLAMMLDVDTAFWAVKRYHRLTLFRYFKLLGSKGGGPEWTHSDVASHMGVPPEVLRGRVYKALAAMQRELGGPE